MNRWSSTHVSTYSILCQLLQMHHNKRVLHEKYLKLFKVTANICILVLLHFLPSLLRTMTIFSSSIVFSLQLSIRDEFLLHFELFLTSNYQSCVQFGALSVAVLLKMWSIEWYLVSLTFSKVECHFNDYLQHLIYKNEAIFLAPVKAQTNIVFSCKNYKLYF